MIRKKYVGLLPIVLAQGLCAMNDGLDNKPCQAEIPASTCLPTKIGATAPIQIVVSTAITHKLSASSELLEKATIRNYASFPHSHDNSPADTSFAGDDRKEFSPQSFHHSFYGNYGNDD